MSTAPALPLTPTPRVTERVMLDLLVRHYTQRFGNGERYVCAEHVRSHAGAYAIRTADLIVQDLWPSKGLQLLGHEVKVSRSDWLAELKDPGKAEEFRRYCHRWWLAVPDPLIVRDDLPDGWGLLVVSSRVRVVRPAPRFQPEPLPRGFTASLLRAAAKTAARRASRSR